FLTDRLFVGESLEPRGFAPRLLLARALLRHLRIGLGEGDLVRDGIDLEEGSAFAHEIPLVVEALEKDSRNACAHLDFLGPLHLAHRLEYDGHALRSHQEDPGRNACRDRVGCGSVGPAVLASREQGPSQQSGKVEGRPSVNERHWRSSLVDEFDLSGASIYNHECMSTMLRLRLA